MSRGSRMWQSASTIRFGSIAPDSRLTATSGEASPARVAGSRRGRRVPTLLDGLRVLDLAGEPAAITGRVLADLGAEVVLVEPPGGHPLRLEPHRWSAW